MTYLRSWFSVRSIVVYCLLPLLASCHRPDTKLEEFAQKFREATASDNSEKMLDLYALEGVSGPSRQLLSVAIENELGLPIDSITFLPLQKTPEETIAYTYRGKDHTGTVVPEIRMRVDYATRDRFVSTFTLGKGPQSRWRIVMARPIEE